MRRRHALKRVLLCLTAGLVSVSLIAVVRTQETLVNYRSTGGWLFRVYMPSETNAVQLFAGWPVGPAIIDKQPEQDLPPHESMAQSFEALGFEAGHGREAPNLRVMRHISSTKGRLTAADRGLWARPHRYVFLQVPFWFFASALTLLMLAPVLPLLTRRLRCLPPNSDRFCENCGYDLRSTPERCPECGTEPPSGTETGSGTGQEPNR